MLQPAQFEKDNKHWADSGSAFASLCSTRLMTASEERAALRRMHFFRYLAHRVLSDEPLDEWSLTRACGLLKAALWHRDLVVQANMRLVVSIVKKLPAHPNCHDELISDGAVALLRAIEKFNPMRGYRFSTYATPAVRRECFQRMQERSLQRGRYAQVSELTDICSTARTSVDRAHWIAWRKRLQEMLGNLTRREQVIIRSRFCLGAHRHVKTLQRLADALKISKERVRQLERRALEKLRKEAELQNA